jgi:hypothetical protein
LKYSKEGRQRKRNEANSVKRHSTKRIIFGGKQKTRLEGKETSKERKMLHLIERENAKVL